MKIFAPALLLVVTAIAGNKVVTAQPLACIDGQTTCPNGANTECAAEGCDSTYSCVDNICRQLPSSAPSPAALSYTYVGNGVCLDGTDEVFSFIAISEPDYSQDGCNALCRSDFYDPLLVGFGELSPGDGGSRFKDGGCICFYAGGTVPSFKPPKNTAYSQGDYPGNGPVTSSTGSTSSYVNCYAYAQGTGSPTTPGATKSPITPSPTGTATSAPTPRGITDYNFVGTGYCLDVNDNYFPFIATPGSSLNTIDDCAEFCRELPSPHLVGFEFETFNDGDTSCACLYSGDDLPTPPSGLTYLEFSTVETGTGPIRGTNVTVTNNVCYAFPQGTASPTTTPTVAPTASPATTAPTKAPTTSSPSAKPISPAPSTTAPTKAPVTLSPSAKPISPTPSPQSAPTKAPVSTLTPSAKPISPTPSPQSKSSKETKSTKSSKNSKVV